MANLNKIQKKLEKEKKSLAVEIASLSQPRDFGAEMDKSAEEVDESEEFGNQLALQQVLKSKLEDINSTLRKINEGRYGICEQCGRKISWIVLKFSPISRLCRKCKKNSHK